MYQERNPNGDRKKEKSCCHGCQYLGPEGCEQESCFACNGYACHTAKENMSTQERRVLKGIQADTENILLQHGESFVSIRRKDEADIRKLFLGE